MKDWLLGGVLVAGCVEPERAPALDATTDAADAAALPGPCADDRFGFGTPDLPAATLGLGRQDGLVLCDDEGDTLALDAPVGLPVAAVVEAERPVVVVGRGASAEILAQASGRNPMIRLPNPPGGLRVTITPEAPGPPVRYALTLGLAPTTCDEPAEPDGPATPRPLADRLEGVVCADDADWLRLEGPAGVPVDLTVTLLGGQGVRLDVLGGDAVIEGVDVQGVERLGLLLPTEGLDLRMRPLGPGGGWSVAAVVGEEPTATGELVGTLDAWVRSVGPEGLGPPQARPATGAWIEGRHLPTQRRAGLGFVNESGVFEVPVAAPAGPVEAWLWARVGSVEVGAAGASVWTAPVADFTEDTPAAGALHVALTAAEGLARLAPYLPEGPPAPLRIDWRPGFAPACGTCFRPESGHIELSGAVGDHDEWDTAVILHELGHHIAATYSRDDSPGGRHDGDRTWPALAWSEGFATFHAAWQQGDPRVGDLRRAGYQVIDLETLDDPRAFGTDDGRPDGDVSELLVAALLWDVFDGGPDDDDDVEVPNEVLWPALLGGLASLTTDEGAPGLDLLDVLDVLAGAAPEADLAALARGRGIGWPL
jgi:hypothetical protein